MKRIIYYISVAFIAITLISSCKDITFAKELKQEQLLIEDFIKRSKITVIKGTPTDSTIWGENDYYLLGDGLYFHLVNPGVGEAVVNNDIIIPRYKQYTLGTEPVVINNLTTIDNPNPTFFYYGNLSESFPAFHTAVSLMKRNESEAKIIVPSKIGSRLYWSPATPMGYDLKIKIQK